MEDESGQELKDYKVFNFSGEPYIIQVDFNRFIEHKRNLYTKEWQYIEAEIEYPTDSKTTLKRPTQLEKMLELARILSNGSSHVRTDFYSVDDKLYFGELTFYHGAGFERFDPLAFGIELRTLIKLDNVRQGGKTRWLYPLAA